MKRIRTINSEADIWESIVKNFKHYRTINQTAFYLNEGASHYYDPKRRFPRENYDCLGIAKMLANIFTEKKGLKVALVSLACGNCGKDKVILEHLQNMGHSVPFFGVDSSMAMLYKANGILCETAFQHQLVCADIGAFDFRKRLDRMIGEYDLTIYLFLGNILGNLNQNYMSRILKNILRPGDYMLLDVAGFQHITPQVEDRMLERYTGYLSTPAEARFLMQPLKALGISEGCGQLTLKVTNDAAHQAKVYMFGFRVYTPDSVNLEEEIIDLSTNERIDLLHILVYNLNTLAEFLEKRGFEFKDQVVGEFMNQLLFQRC